MIILGLKIPQNIANPNLVINKKDKKCDRNEKLLNTVSIHTTNIIV